MHSADQPRLSLGQVYNVKTGALCTLPPVDWFVAGFTCTTKSALNSATRGKRLSPCQTGEGDTGKVPDGARHHHLHPQRPPLPPPPPRPACSKVCSDSMCRRTSRLPVQAWAATESYIRKARPRLVLLENLSCLMGEAEPGVMADSDHIIKQLRSLGYSARARGLGAPWSRGLCSVVM